MMAVLSTNTPGVFEIYDEESRLAARYNRTSGTLTDPEGNAISRTPRHDEALTAATDFMLAADNSRLLNEALLANIVVLRDVVVALNEITNRPNAEINASPAVAIKNLARLTKAATRQLARVAKILGHDVRDIDIGPE